MKTIEINCANCQKIVVKELKEYNRQIKNGHTRFFCNNSCACIKRNEENSPIENYKNFGGKIGKGVPNDEYSPFRWYVLRGEYRCKKRNYDCNLTVEYLKQLWDSQNGTCPFTGWKIVLPKNTTKPWKNQSPNNASIDRIDNSKGYIEGNVRFIAYMANIARQCFVDEQLIEFCKAVAENQK